MTGALNCSSEEDGWKEATEADLKATAEVKAPEVDSSTPRQQAAHGRGVPSPVQEHEAGKVCGSRYGTTLNADFTPLCLQPLCLCLRFPTTSESRA